MCLTEKQANHVYKKVEEGGIIHVDTLQVELKQEMEREDDNPYKRVVLKKVHIEKNKSHQIEDWSIFTNQIKYTQHDERTKHGLDLTTLDYQQHHDLYCQLKGEESSSLYIDFGISSECQKLKYLDLYEDMSADMVYTNRFDENSDLTTTYDEIEIE